MRTPVPGGVPFPGTHRAFYADIPGPRTVMGWPIVPSGLTDLLLRVQRDVRAARSMSPRTASAPTTLVEGGTVHDQDRIDYLRDHLGAVLARAASRGSTSAGYYVWTLLDNFEWAWGYEKRFGLVHVDFADQSRTLKDSARWYAEVIAKHGL